MLLLTDSDVFEFDTTPTYENCAQVGEEGYWEQAQKEGRALIQQLRRQFGEEPEGAHFFIKRNPHDSGTYLTVALRYRIDSEPAYEYVTKVDEEFPDKWDESARQEMGLDAALVA